MTPVISSNISAIGYDAEKKQLNVTFKNGKTFGYADVSTIFYRELANTDSVGKFFNKHIKAEHEAFEVLDADDNEASEVKTLQAQLTSLEKHLLIIERLALSAPIDREILSVAQAALSEL